MKSNNHTLNQFFLVYFNVYDSSEMHLFLSEFSILMTLTLFVASDILNVEFVRQIISLFFINDKYDIFMIFIMK